MSVTVLDGELGYGFMEEVKKATIKALKRLNKLFPSATFKKTDQRNRKLEINVYHKRI